MKVLLILVLVSFFSLRIFATPQTPDRLIYNGDTLSVYLSLPNEFYKPDTVFLDPYESIYTVNLFGDKETCGLTSCGREYRATWEIIDNQLYLTGIYSCCYYKDSIKADLALLFKGKVRNGKVKADWVTGDIISSQGKFFYYSYPDYITLYEREFHFKKGKLTGTKLYDNSKSKQSIYSQDQEKLKQYIYSNIRWDILPQQDSVIKVFVEFSANEKGIIDNVKVKRGYNDIYDQEAIRIIKSIPEWDIYLSRGKFMRFPWMISIVFSNENRLR